MRLVFRKQGIKVFDSVVLGFVKKERNEEISDHFFLSSDIFRVFFFDEEIEKITEFIKVRVDKLLDNIIDESGEHW